MSESLAYTISPPHTLPEAFAHRLIQFYASQPEPVLGPIWRGVTERFYGQLHAGLVARNAQAVLGFFNTLYKGDTVFGIDLGGMATPQALDSYKRSWLACLIAAANAVGALPVLNPEQPVESVSVQQIIEPLESKLGFRVHHPGGCCMAGIKVEGRFIPWKLIEAICVYQSICRLCQKRPSAIVEIGAGAGFLAYLWALDNRVYQTLDLPLVSVIHGYLLACAFGQSAVWFSGEPFNSLARIRIHGLSSHEVSGFDICLNEDSLPEMPERVRYSYLEFISKKLRRGGFFLSVNQESHRGGQRSVSDAMRDFTSMRLMYRCPYWARSGYVEEAWLRGS